MLEGRDEKSVVSKGTVGRRHGTPGWPGAVHGVCASGPRASRLLLWAGTRSRLPGVTPEPPSPRPEAITSLHLLLQVKGRGSPFVPIRMWVHPERGLHGGGCGTPGLRRGLRSRLVLARRSAVGDKLPGSRMGVQRPRPEVQGQAAGPLGFGPCRASQRRAVSLPGAHGVQDGRGGRHPCGWIGTQAPRGCVLSGVAGQCTAGVDGLACAPCLVGSDLLCQQGQKESLGTGGAPSRGRLWLRA